jgi:hypothetical protein
LITTNTGQYRVVSQGRRWRTRKELPSKSKADV